MIVVIKKIILQYCYCFNNNKNEINTGKIKILPLETNNITMIGELDPNEITDDYISECGLNPEIRDDISDNESEFGIYGISNHDVIDDIALPATDNKNPIIVKDHEIEGQNTKGKEKEKHPNKKLMNNKWSFFESIHLL